jgi:protein involved in polysaccharide export with SLBB domain
MAAHLRIDSPRAAIRLAILTPQQRRNRPRRSEEPRLNAALVTTLVPALITAGSLRSVMAPGRTSKSSRRTKNSSGPTATVARPLPAGTSVPATNGTTAPTGAFVADEKYKLRIGDKLSFQILEDREPPPKSLVVMDSGEVDAPYIGRVQAVDKTCKQLSDELKALLEKEYYYRATVVLAVDVANRILGRVYIWGQVRNQGAIEMLVNENLTAGKAILRAGGFADFANKKKVKVIRGAASATGGKQSFDLNMVEILEDGKTEKYIVLQPDDFIIVPSRLINF